MNNLYPTQHLFFSISFLQQFCDASPDPGYDLRIVKLFAYNALQSVLVLFPILKLVLRPKFFNIHHNHYFLGVRVLICDPWLILGCARSFRW